MLDMEVVQALGEAALVGAALLGVSAAAALVQCGNKRGAGKNGQPLSKKTKRSAKSAKKSAKRSVKSAKDSAKKSAKSAKKSVKQSASSAKQSARSAKERTKQSAQSLKKSARDAAPAAASAKSSKRSDRPASQKAPSARVQAPLTKQEEKEWVQAARPNAQPSARTAAPMTATSQQAAAQQPENAQPQQAVAYTGADLHMQPQQLRFAQQGGILNVVLHNPSDQRQAVKVKCSDNKLYRVNPVYAFVEPNATLQVNVSRQNGASKADKLVFVTADAPAEEVQAQAFFKNRKTTNNQHVSVLPLLA